MRGQVRIGVDVEPAPSWSFAGANVDDYTLTPGHEMALDTRALPDGTHTVRVGVRDRSLRYNTRWVEATLRTDNTPPALTLDTRQPAALQGRTALIQARASEPVEMALEMAAGKRVQFVQEGDAYVALVGVEQTLNPGKRPLKIVAQDEAGNQTVLDASLEVARGAFVSEDIFLMPEFLRFLTSGEYDQEQQRLQEFYGASGGTRLWDAAFSEPVRGVISSGFGIARTYNGGAARSHHVGTDFDVPTGTTISAVAKGKVVFADKLTVRGNAVIVDHGVGVHTCYYHLSRIDVKPNDVVNKGQALGLSGATGMVTAPHLHLEFRIAGIAVDPMEWLNRRFL